MAYRNLLWAFCLLAVSASLFGADIAENKDVAFGPDDLQRLDIYRPKDAKDKLPTVLWIHGGGWYEGDKRHGANGISTFAQTLMDEGYVAVACNYRLAPKHHHPAQVDDVQRAVRWLRANADKYNIDPDRIGAVGISAGGHLAAMLAASDSRAKHDNDLDRLSSQVKTAVAINGPMELVDAPELRTKILSRALAGLVGKETPAEIEKALGSASPTRLINKDSSPMLMIVGRKDTLVPNHHSALLAEALKKHKVDAEVLVLEGAGHAIFPSTSPDVSAATLKWLKAKL